MQDSVRDYLARIGSQGGRRSRRQLSKEQARDMVRVREARRAYRDFHTECFWSFDPEYKVTVADVPWVIEQLKKCGGWRAWRKAAELCR